MAKFSFSSLWLLVLVLLVVSTVPNQVLGQKRCRIILNPKGCNLPDCQKQCYLSYNGNGQCTSGGSFGTYICSCFYNCGKGQITKT
ncbi:OLC1v1012489C1 [Oldenlandia corymbosa var. corymbosa]|uniref:OLC1v1012489C1 n=1 Tax=Oldenlandia corymbosa var. corymbosa TaxID=529605 RepID=A0AAV1DW95_OLDCO|nr:OLC1v1012489C1 [Oldenlandia corymbosa var. corymbosa]